MCSFIVRRPKVQNQAVSMLCVKAVGDPSLPRLLFGGCQPSLAFLVFQIHGSTPPSSQGVLPAYLLSYCLFFFIRTQVILD